MPPPQTEVLITVAGMETARHVFAPGEYVLGRDADCHIPIEAGLVSRRHAKLTLNFDNALIEDLGSDGGTHINGKPIPKGGRTRLWPSQKIQVGAATIELRRLKADSDPDRTLAPTQEVVKRVLPEAFLREKKYDIGGVVAQGGMGAILDAKEATIERTVAMKVMLDSNAPDDLLRFLNEAKITGQLEHPNIVPVHELSVDENGQPFYTMKFVKGITLRKVLEKMAAGESAQSSVRSAQSSDSATKRDTEHCALNTEHFSLPVLLTIFQKVCDALAFAHSKGVIHRDLKPENIMVGDYGEVLLMDWGLAKRLRNTEPQGPEPVEGDIRTIRHSVAEEMPATAVFDPSALASTMAGAIMGTPQYMAPEQARGEIETLDQRADIYALGAILFHLLFLRPSVSGSDSMQIVGKVARGEIEWWNATSGRVSSQRSEASQTTAEEKRARRSRSTIPDSLAAVVRKAMALDKAARYRSVEDLQADILAYQTGFATSAENASAWKQFTLLVKRHKAASIGLAAVLIVGSVLGTKAILEGQRAERGEQRALRGEAEAKAEAKRAEDALTSLRETAPTFIAQAETQIAANDLAGALKNATAAVQLDPIVADYHTFRAHLLLAQPDVRTAAEEYRAALALHPDDKEAREHLTVCEEILRSERDTVMLTSTALHRIHALAMKYGRPSHALYVMRLVRDDEAEKKRLVETWRQRLKQGGVEISELSILSDNTCKLRLGHTARDLRALSGMPVKELLGAGTAVEDLRPLEGMTSLRKLDLEYTKVADLSPLRGLSLTELRIAATDVSSIEPLKGMSLRKLSLNNVQRITNIEALRGMPLEDLDIGGTAIVQLSPLHDMPLRRLELSNMPKLKDITPLAGMPIVDLSLHAPNQITDFTPLRGLRLTRFGVAGMINLPDLTLLEGMPLKHLYLLSMPQIKSIEPLRGMPFDESLILSGTGVTDLSPLRGSRLKWLDARNTRFRDLSPLIETSIRDLNLSGSPGPVDLAPLAQCRNLIRLTLPITYTNLEQLRAHPSLTHLSAKDSIDKPAQTVGEFWAEYDTMTPAEKNFQEARLKTLAQVAAALPALGMAEGKTIIVKPWGVRLLIEKLPVTDISGLRPLPIDALSLFETKVADLAPLRGMRLKELSFTKTDVKDVSPLLDMPILEAAMVPQGATNLGVLRQHPTLQWLGWEGDWDKDANRPKLTTAEFWARYDAQQAAGKK